MQTNVLEYLENTEKKYSSKLAFADTRKRSDIQRILKEC